MYNQIDYRIPPDQRALALKKSQTTTTIIVLLNFCNPTMKVLTSNKQTAMTMTMKNVRCTRPTLRLQGQRMIKSLVKIVGSAAALSKALVNMVISMASFTMLTKTPTNLTTDCLWSTILRTRTTRNLCGQKSS